MKALVIDDEPDIRLLASVGLTASGFTVVVAEGGGQGLRLARDEQPDVILLDVMMPVMDGYATLAALRADAATASIPVLFLTAKAQMVSDPRFAAEPRLGFLRKPFVPRDLAKRVREFLGRL